MKKLKLLFLLLFFPLVSFSQTYYVCLKNHLVEGYPKAYFTSMTNDGSTLSFALRSGNTVSYDLATVDTVTQDNPAASFTSFKFNNKFNPGLAGDVIFTINGTQLTATAGGIGKYMTPSFQTNRTARVLVNDSLQASKVTHHNFSTAITYKVIDDSCKVLTYEAGKYSMQPVARTYTATVTWLTDTGKVPRIDINIDGGKSVVSKDYYLHAQITIDGGGVYDNFQDSVYIKGRGNSTWGGASGPKNPYRLKFDEKVKPFGLTGGKNWVLLANRMDPTLMTNSVAMRVAQMVGAAYANHAVPVDLYMNGTYSGSYVFTEHVSISNNSIDIEDNSTLMELDLNYDEDNKFVSAAYKLPVMIKNPENIVAEAPARRLEAPNRIQRFTLSAFQNDFNTMEAAVKEGNVGDYLNIDSLARYIFVYDFCHNMELNHPKSVYLFKPLGAQKYIFGPPWDFDWAYGYELGYYYSQYDVPVIYPKFNTTKSGGFKDGSGYTFFLQAMTQEPVMKAYYRLWRKFINEGGVQEIIDYIDTYAKYADPSFLANEKKFYDGWGYYYSNYPYYISDMKEWIQNRTNYIYTNLKSFPDDPVIPDKVEPLSTQPSNKAVDGVKVSLLNSALVIDADADVTLPVYDAGGRKIAMIAVRKGSNVYMMIPHGLLIINRQKVFIP